MAAAQAVQAPGSLILPGPVNSAETPTSSPSGAGFADGFEPLLASGAPVMQSAVVPIRAQSPQSAAEPQRSARSLAPINTSLPSRPRTRISVLNARSAAPAAAIAEPRPTRLDRGSDKSGKGSALAVRDKGMKDHSIKTPVISAALAHSSSPAVTSLDAQVPAGTGLPQLRGPRASAQPDLNDCAGVEKDSSTLLPSRHEMVALPEQQTGTAADEPHSPSSSLSHQQPRGDAAKDAAKPTDLDLRVDFRGHPLAARHDALPPQDSESPASLNATQHDGMPSPKVPMKPASRPTAPLPATFPYRRTLCPSQQANFLAKQPPLHRQTPLQNGSPNLRRRPPGRRTRTPSPRSTTRPRRLARGSTPALITPRPVISIPRWVG